MKGYNEFDKKVSSVGETGNEEILKW